MTQPNTKIIAISDITFDRDLQFRTFTDARHVADLKSVWEEDGKFDELPVLSSMIDPETKEEILYIKDGTHRILAAKDAGASQIECHIEFIESREDAMFAAMSVNTKHGKALSTDDIKLMLRAIKDSKRAEQFKKNPFRWDRNKLKEFLGCSLAKVSKAMSETTTEMETDLDYRVLQLRGEGHSLGQISKQLGVPKSTVADRVTKLDELSEIHKSSQSARTEPTVVTPENDSNCQWDDDVYECLDIDEEEFEETETDRLIASLCRTENTNVIKPSAIPKADIDSWLDTFNSWTAEEQAEALSRIRK